MHLLSRGGDRLYVYALLVAIFTYATVFSATTIWKHNQFNSYAWDLGTFDQMLHNSVFEGRPFYYTLDLFMNPSGQYFAIHFSPILILLFPLYRLIPSPEMLLVVKSATIGAAAYPLFLLAKRLTGDTRIGVLLGLTYLFSPCIEGANWFDFQPQSLLPLLVFSSYYLLLTRRTRLYLASATLTLLVEEHSTIIILTIFAVYLLAEGFHGLPNRLRDRRTLLLLIATIALSAATLTASIYFKQLYPHDPTYEDIYVSTDAYSILGFEGNAFTAPLYAVTHPADLLKALTHDSTLKIIYIALLFAPLLFTPLLSGAPAASMLLLTPFLLSNYRPYYMIGAHYPLYFMPLMYITAAHFLSRRGGGGRGLATAMLVSTTIFALALSPLSPTSTQLNNGFLWYPQNDLTPTEVTQIHEIIDAIPADAPILTQNQFFPHVSNRLNAYSIPVTTFSDAQLPQIEAYLKTIMKRCDYVLLDTGDGSQLTPMAVRLAESDLELKVTASAGNTTLYRRTP